MSEIGSHYDKLLWGDRRLACFTFGNSEISYNGVINMEVLNSNKQHTIKYIHTLNIIGYTNKTNNWFVVHALLCLNICPYQGKV